MTTKCVVALFAFSVSWGLALAQSFPGKPLRIIVPTIAGSAPDVRVRQIAPKLSEAVGQPVIVDNRSIIGSDQRKPLISVDKHLK